MSRIREEAAPYGESAPGGYRKRPPEEYDPSLCLLPRDVIDFILATQPKERERLKQHYGAAVPDGDFYVRSGPGTVRLPAESAKEYIRTRFRPGSK